MMKISELRSKLREIRKKLAKNIGYLDFKYLHKMKRPELEALLKKYEKFETQVVGTIQGAIRNKQARDEASKLLNKRDERQVLRDLEMRLSAINRPQSAPAVISGNIGTSASKKRQTIRNLYDEPLTPFTTFNLFNSQSPAPITQRLFEQRSIEQGRVVPLPRVPKTQRPQTTSLKSIQLRQRLNLADRPLTASPNLPALQLRQRLKSEDRPLTASSVSRLSALPRVEVKPRPSSSGRTFNKFKPI